MVWDVWFCSWFCGEVFFNFVLVYGVVWFVSLLEGFGKSRVVFFGVEVFELLLLVCCGF